MEKYRVQVACVIHFELKLAVDSNNFSYIGNNILLDIYKPMAGHQQSIINRILPILLWITWWQAVFQNELSNLICTSLYALISFSLFRIRCFISCFLSKNWSVAFVVSVLLLSYISIAFQSISVYFNCEIY